jgi:hypothetical protein
MNRHSASSSVVPQRLRRLRSAQPAHLGQLSLRDVYLAPDQQLVVVSSAYAQGTPTTPIWLPLLTEVTIDRVRAESLDRGRRPRAASTPPSETAGAGPLLQQSGSGLSPGGAGSARPGRSCGCRRSAPRWPARCCSVGACGCAGGLAALGRVVVGEAPPDHHPCLVAELVVCGDSPEAGARVQGGAPGRRRPALLPAIAASRSSLSPSS